MRDTSIPYVFADRIVPQFSRWWEPMIDTVPVLGKIWRPGSATAALVRAVLCNRDIVDKQRETAVHKVSYILFVLLPYSLLLYFRSCL